MKTRLGTALLGGSVEVSKASRGTVSSYVLGAPHQYGQPYELAASTADVSGLITMERMREIVLKTPTAGASMNAVLDYLGGVPVTPRCVDASQKIDDARRNYLNGFMAQPNPNDTWRRYKLKLFRDMFTLGWAAIEKEYDADGNVVNLWPLDAARLRVDYDEHETLLGYNMLDVRGMPISRNGTEWAWRPEDIIPLIMNPTTHSFYSTSRISQLFTLAVVEDLMVHFIGTRFTDSNIPYGLLDLGEITQTELAEAIDMWNSQVNVQHKIMLTGSKGSKWYPFAYDLDKLQATLLLADIRARIMGILGVTMNELGDSQDINKSNGYNLSYTFKKRAIEPFLDEFCTAHTAFWIVQNLNWPDLEYTFAEIDSRDELLQAEIDQINLKNGIESPNDVANRKGKPSVPGGDDRYMVIGNTAIPLDLLRPFAETTLAALQMVDSGGGPNGDAPVTVSKPIIRGPAVPDTSTTPNGKGMTGSKISFQVPQQARGAVEQNQRAGNRKDDTHP